MLSGCGGLRGSGVLGGVIGACWGIPSTLRPSILTLSMGSPRCIQIEKISLTARAEQSLCDSLLRVKLILQFTAMI